jgi:hypothetical protein
MSKDNERDNEPMPREPISPEGGKAGDGEARPERGYEVGYGKPPKHTRFKPGQSGNPPGRPRGSQNMRTMLRDVLTQPVPTTLNGKRKTVPALKAAYQKMLAEALLKGNFRALHLLTQLAERAGLMDDDTATADAPLSAEDEALMEAFLRRMGASELLERGEPEVDAGRSGTDAGGKDEEGGR